MTSVILRSNTKGVFGLIVIADVLLWMHQHCSEAYRVDVSDDGETVTARFADDTDASLFAVAFGQHLVREDA